MFGWREESRDGGRNKWMVGMSDQWMNEYRDVCMVGWKGGWRHGWLVGSEGGWIDGWRYG